MLSPFAHNVPVGKLSAGRYDTVVIQMTWRVRSGDLRSYDVGGHITIEERRGRAEGVLPGFLAYYPGAEEVGVIEAKADGSVFIRKPSVPHDQSNPRRAVTWDPGKIRISAGATMRVDARLEIGVELLEGKTELDVVSIVEPVTATGVSGQIGQHRDPNLFGIIEGTAFAPIMLGRPNLDLSREAAT